MSAQEKCSVAFSSSLVSSVLTCHDSKMAAIETPAGESLTCKLCSRVLPTTAGGRVKGKTWTCRHCLSLETLLYRNLGSSDRQGWSVESKTDFFKKAASLEIGNYTWATVKTMVVETQATRLVKEQSNKVSAQSLPLGVWLKQGWEEEHVKKFPAEEDPILGQLYAVPVKETSMSEAKQFVEEQIQRKEKEAQSNKRKPTETEASEQAAWDVVPHQAQKVEAAASGKKAKTTGDSATAKAKAEKVLAKESLKADRANEQMTLLASKATGQLTKLLKSSQGLQAQAQKACVDDQQLLEALQKCMEVGTTWNRSCVDVLPLATKARGAGARLESLPFTNKSLQEYLKNATQLHKEIRSKLKAKKAESEQKEEGAETK